MTRMGRPPKLDRDEVLSQGLSLKLSVRDREILDRLLEARRIEILEQTGERVNITAASMIRSLLYREAKARGLTDDENGASPATESPPPPAPPRLPSSKTPSRKKERSR